MVSNWSTDEERLVDEFRKIMKSEAPKWMYEDRHVFYKFLKARDFNLNNAETMLRKHLKWRKAMQIDTMVTDYHPPEVLRKYISQTFFGFSKEGHLLQYAAIGSCDGRGLLKSSNKIDFLRCILQEIEKNKLRLKQYSEKIGRTVNQCIYIYDMENMNLAKATHKRSLESFAEGAVEFQDNYPEMLHSLYIINASVYFTICFPIIKAILSGPLLNKIKFFGKTGWKQELLKIIDADVLPAFLGGNRTDPDGDPMCRSFICHAGMIPESYYLTKDISKIANKPDTQHLVIDRHSSAIVEVNVPEEHSILNWEFITKSNDIGFGLMLEQPANKSAKMELIPVHKMETENESEVGMYRCKCPGIYNIIFDNTYSWIYSKEVYYRTWITSEKENKLSENCNDIILDFLEKK